MWKRTIGAGMAMAALAFSTSAQENIGYRINDNIPIVQDGTPLSMPFVGGFSSPQFSAIDLNGDQIKDLVVFDRQGDVVRPFINGGTANSVDYTYAPEYRVHFPPMSDYAIFKDYNCDGKEDLFTYHLAGFRVWRNTSTNGDLSFELEEDHLFANFGSGDAQLYNVVTDIAAIDDIDGDGDLDFLAFGLGGSDGMVFYYKNYSQENGHGCDSLIYELDDRCWGNFEESGTSDSIILGVSCKGGGAFEGGADRHVGSTLLVFDNDNDGDKDLVLGDVSFPNLKLLINGGDAQAANMVSYDPDFPSSSGQPVDIVLFPAAYYLDVDNDNVKDLLVSPNTDNAAEDTANAWLYFNEGADNQPDFQFEKKRFISDEMIELGSGCNPAFFDENGDGLLDIVVGNFGYFDVSGTPVGTLTLFRNTGTAAAPAFELVDDDYLSMSSTGILGFHPAFGDIDGDGDQDLMLGDRNGYLHFYENTAGSGNAATFVLTAPEYQNIDVGESAAPQIVDVNRDGLPDLLVGERSGTINYFENLGTATNPSFTTAPTNDFFGGIDNMIGCCTGYSTPYLAEWDDSGDYFLGVGSEEGIVRVFGNIDGNLNGNFSLRDSIVTYGHRSNLTGAFLDNDDKLDLITGEYAGGFQILKKEFNVPIGFDDPVAEVLNSLKAYPNPARDQFTVEIPAEPGSLIELSLYDLMGRQHLSRSQAATGSGNTVINLSLSSLPAGMYLITVRLDGQARTLRMVKQ